MTVKEPVTELNRHFSSPDATATPWSEARELLEEAEIFWLSTVRQDGRPHVTPLPAIWLDGALYFTTGEHERKTKNLASNANCILTTGNNSMQEGLDLVVEGEAVQVSDEGLLQKLAELWLSKLDWEYEVRNGAFHGEGGRALVFQVAPTTAFGFGKGGPFSQTRWRF